ncbi:MAG: hypothetical protein QM811_06625 [Pirellulales bacterium]
MPEPPPSRAPREPIPFARPAERDEISHIAAGRYDGGARLAAYACWVGGGCGLAYVVSGELPRAAGFVELCGAFGVIVASLVYVAGDRA